MPDPKKPRWPGWGGTQPSPPGPPSDGGPAGPGPPGPAGHSQPGSAPPPRNGLGITALILGIIGLLAGIIPILFWIAAVLGIIALILGVIGARRAKQGYATNRRMSLTGAVLGGLAIVLSIIGALIVNDAFEDIERDLDITETTAPPTPGTTPPPQEETAAPEEEATTPTAAGALDFDATQRYEDGLQVTVSAPRPFSPSDTAAGHSPGNRAVTVEITVLNGSEERLDLDRVRVEAKDAEGRTAGRIFDSATDITGGLSGTLLPGRQSVATYAFDLPSSAATSLDVEVTPGFNYDSAIWSGSTS